MNENTFEQSNWYVRLLHALSGAHVCFQVLILSQKNNNDNNNKKNNPQDFNTSENSLCLL